MHYLDGWVGLNNIEKIASLPDVIQIRVLHPGRTFAVTTAGDTILGTKQVRDTFSFSGNGIKVGVISDGVTNLSAAIASGDLPSNVHVLDNSFGGNEGTAMLEIVHDMAPSAELYFETGKKSDTKFDTALENLSESGCSVIVDDVGFPNEPYFEDGSGTTSAKVKEVLGYRTPPIIISAAGNAGDPRWGEGHYQGEFYPDNQDSLLNDFGKGSSSDYLYATIAPHDNLTVFLQWNDQWRNANNQYDLFLEDKVDGKWKDIWGNNNTLTDKNPIREIPWTNDNDTYNTDVRISVRKHSMSDISKTLELYMYTGSNKSGIWSTNLVATDSIYGHQCVSDVITVGAIDSNISGYTTNEAFSSQGPCTQYYPDGYVQRPKPDIMGVDNVSVSGAGKFPCKRSPSSALSREMRARLR